jgi:hypothetical protein
MARTVTYFALIEVEILPAPGYRQQLAARGCPNAWHLSHQPFGQVPWLTDGDISIFESGAILLHHTQTRWRILLRQTDQSRRQKLAAAKPPRMGVPARARRWDAAGCGA